MEIDVKALDLLPVAEEAGLAPCVFSCFRVTCGAEETCFWTLSFT